MNSRVKRLWVEALRSGEYQQGRNALRVQDTFCCLGVLCDLYIGETFQAEWEAPEGEEGDSPCYSFVEGDEDPDEDPITCYLPTSVVEWAGLPFGNPNIEVEGSSCDATLAYLNDEGRDFEFIANIIEHQL